MTFIGQFTFTFLLQMSCTTNEDCSDHGVCNETCQCFYNYKGDKCDECISDDYQMIKQGYCAEKCDFICEEGQVCELDPDFDIDLCVCEYENQNIDDKCNSCLKGYHLTEYDHCQPDACVKNFKLCDNQGDCKEIDGKFQCVCIGDFAGTFCEDCKNGLAKTDEGKCIPRECVNSKEKECSGEGVCVTATRECTCKTGYAGKYCQKCASGFKPVVNYYGTTCYPEICFVEGETKPCSNNGKCMTQGTESYCVCNPKISGPQCQDCAEGFEKIDGSCLSTECIIDGQDCGNHGFCDIRDGSYSCTCWPTYDPINKCTTCFPGYSQIEGACISNSCVIDGKLCNNHGHCNIADYFNKIYKCGCSAGYKGKFCTECVDSFILVPDGLCVNPLCEINQTECSNNGRCIGNYSGVWECYCNTGASGTKCERCEKEFVHTLNGKCVIEDCYAENQECGGNGKCELTNLEHKCNCAENFSIESRCVNCSEGFILNHKVCVQLVNNKLSGGIIAGIVIAIVVVLVSISIGIWFIVKGKKARNSIHKTNNVPKDQNFGGSDIKNRTGSNNFI